jgi:hypothetical protein
VAPELFFRACRFIGEGGNKKGPFRDPVKRQRQEVRVSPGLLLALFLQQEWSASACLPE